MKARCCVPNNISYKYYGGVGIKVCNRWEKFENFRDDMYESYLEHYNLHGKDTSIDRTNSKDNYKKSNCCWSTMEKQNNNRSCNIKILYNNKKYSIKELSEIKGIKYHTLRARLFIRKWPLEKALEKR